MKNLEQLLNDYVEACIKNGEAQEEGNSRVTNAMYKKNRKVREQLKKISENNDLISLMPFLAHQNDYVKCHAATALLPYATEEALATLAEVSKRGGILGILSKTIISEWHKGNEALHRK